MAEKLKEDYDDAVVDKYLELFESLSDKKDLVDGVDYLLAALGSFLDEEVARSLKEIATAVNEAKEADFTLVFDPTLVRGMSYYTGTIFEIAIPEFGGSCGGGGRYDKMVGGFTGQDTPACGFSIGFERIIMLLLESDFQVPGGGSCLPGGEEVPGSETGLCYQAGQKGQRGRRPGAPCSHEQEQEVPEGAAGRRRI